MILGGEYVAANRPYLASASLDDDPDARDDADRERRGGAGERRIGMGFA